MIVRNMLAVLGFLGIVAAAGVGVYAYGGFYDDDARPPRLSVSSRGLDLTTRDGLDVLNDRIDRAVHAICTIHDSRDLSASRRQRQCRENAWAGVRPQIDRAIDRERWQRRAGFDPHGTVSYDIARQPSDIRKSIGSAVARAFDSGITANWYSWGAKGLVFVEAPYIDHDATCRTVIVTSKARGEQTVLTRGALCRSPYGVLEAPLPV